MRLKWKEPGIVGHKKLEGKWAPCNNRNGRRGRRAHSGRNGRTDGGADGRADGRRDRRVYSRAHSRRDRRADAERVESRAGDHNMLKNMDNIRGVPGPD